MYNLSLNIKASLEAALRLESGDDSVKPPLVEEELVIISRSMPPPETPPYEEDGVVTFDPQFPDEPAAQHWGQRGRFRKSYLVQAIKRDIGTVGGHLYTSDRFYLDYTIEEVRKFLASDDTSFKQYLSEYFDCDDFAQVLAGRVNGTMLGIPFGTIWYYGITNGRFWGHAVNLFYDHVKDRMFMVEPQNDKVYEWKKDWRVGLIVI